MGIELPSPSQARQDLLDALRLEDDQCLWEVVWALTGHGVGGRLPDKIQLARAVVLDLVNSGDVELWRIDWPRSTAVPLEPTDARRLAAEDAPWFDPENCDLLVEIRLPA